MTKKKKPTPRLVVADAQGNIYDHPDLTMLVRRGGEFGPPRPDEIVSLPAESDLFMLPARRAVGLDPVTGDVQVQEDFAVAAFACPGYTLSGLAAYVTDKGAPRLPLFAYGAVGFENGRFWVCASRVDEDQRQVFKNVPKDKIKRGAEAMLKSYPDNRLVRHLATCALSYCCPAARNLALGRFECPLPTARGCNARCLGCISLQAKDSGFPSTQSRITFTPTAAEIVEIMRHHAEREPRPIFSFGQGCEGEPLTEAALITEAVALYRSGGGQGTVNVNTNASLPQTMEPLAQAGLSSIRVSLNSARPTLYEAYYRPVGYAFADVVETIAQAKRHGLFVSLNFLFFPGVSDSEAEVEALTALVSEHKVDFIQLRNLNLDPELYMTIAAPFAQGSGMGLANFRKRLKDACPWLRYGYFNPYLGGPAEHAGEGSKDE